MIQQIKNTLLDNPSMLIEVLERYDFYRPHEVSGSVRFGFDIGGGVNNISIKLTDNEALYVKDFVRDFGGDLFAYIEKTRGASFKDIISVCKEITGISESYGGKTKKKVAFGGFYNDIGKRKSDASEELKTYPESILDEYDNVQCKRFYDDGIGYQSQTTFGVRYDMNTHRIVFPIRDCFGNIIGVKGRRNYDTDDDNDPKYLYLVKCNMSKTLYGYSENYKTLSESREVIIFESEKSVMLAHQYGYRNCVALGSNNLSSEQAKLIMQLNPNRIVFMLDKGLSKDDTIRDAEKFNSYLKFHDIELAWWNWEDNDDLDDKCAPVDAGKDVFEECYELQTENIF